MAKRGVKSVSSQQQSLRKCTTGIRGLDEITEGGLPLHRSTLVCGGPGCGKTLLGMQFLINGALLNNEPGLFISFEETENELVTNIVSLGYDIEKLIKQKKIVIDHIHIGPSDFEETGSYNLDGLFIHFADALQRYKVKRVVLDTIDVLFSHIPNQVILRSELERLFQWLKDQNVTAIVTAEQGNNTLTRYGIEEYVADCVIFLDHRITDQRSVRRLRVVKYRGSLHGSNEYPFLIDQKGILIMPVTSVQLNYSASLQCISTGIKRLDNMLGKGGFYKGSSILITGFPGTGKTSLAAIFARNVCNLGGKCIYFAFEESYKQIVRNMKSINVDLQPYIENKSMVFHAIRPTNYGLERHLLLMLKIIEEVKPVAVIIDPISSLKNIGSKSEIKIMLYRLIDELKSRHITSVFTKLINKSTGLFAGGGVSSLMDVWIHLKYFEGTDQAETEKNRVLYVLKSRGMQHSNQMRELIFSSDGVDLQDIYVGMGKILTGSGRALQLMQEKAKAAERNVAVKNKNRELINMKNQMLNQIRQLKHNINDLDSQIKETHEQEAEIDKIIRQNTTQMSAIRSADDLTAISARSSGKHKGKHR